MTLCRALRQPGMKVVTSEPLGSDSLFTKSRHERVTWLLFCASAATSSPGRDNGLKSGGYTSCVNPAPVVMSFYTFEVSGHGRTGSSLQIGVPGLKRSSYRTGLTTAVTLQMR